jgi:hypothetical protein
MLDDFKKIVCILVYDVPDGDIVSVAVQLPESSSIVTHRERNLHVFHPKDWRSLDQNEEYNPPA